MTFNTWLPSIFTCLVIWSTKLFPAPYYISDTSWYFLHKSVLRLQNLMQNIMFLSLPWDQNVDLEMNFHRNKYFTELSVWYWLVTINIKNLLDIVPSIKVFVTYFTYPTLFIHPFHPSLQCLHNPIYYLYLVILDASSHIFQKYHPL